MRAYYPALNALGLIIMLSMIFLREGIVPALAKLLRRNQP